MEAPDGLQPLSIYTVFNDNNVINNILSNTVSILKNISALKTEKQAGKKSSVSAW